MKNLIVTLATYSFAAGVLYGQVVSIEPMIEGRYGHTANAITTLATGTDLLVCGGNDGAATLSSAEVYDGATDTWTYLGEMDSPRECHTATNIAPDQVLICGGWNGSSTNLSSCILFNYSSQNFTSAPAMSVERSNHRAVLLQNVNGTDYVLVTGGYDGFGELASCERLNLSTMEWQGVPDMSVARTSHTATLLADGRVLVTGGYNPLEGFQMASCEIYNPLTNTWSTVASMNIPRDNHAAVRLNNGKVLVSGGRHYNGTLNLFEGIAQCEIFDPQSGTWSPSQFTYGQHSYHEMFLNPNTGEVILPGSTDHSGMNVILTYANTELSNAAGTSWSVYDPLVYGRYRYAGAFITEGLVVCGGIGPVSDSGELYVLSTSVEESYNPWNALHIFPNPAFETATLHIEEAGLLSIYSTDGQLMMEQTVRRGKLQIDPASLAAGVYSLQLISPSGKMMRGKMIRQ